MCDIVCVISVFHRYVYESLWSLAWQFSNVVSEEHIVPNFKGHAVEEEFLYWITLEDGGDRFSRNVTNKPPT